MERTGIERITMNAKEVAEYIGSSYWTVLDMAKRNKIPHFKIGNRVFFRKETIDIWMNQQETDSIKKKELVNHGKKKYV